MIGPGGINYVFPAEGETVIAHDGIAFVEYSAPAGGALRLPTMYRKQIRSMLIR